MDGAVDSKTVSAIPSKIPFLSERAEEYVRNSEFMDKFLEVLGNQFSEKSNPQGIISLGIAENVIGELPCNYFLPLMNVLVSHVQGVYGIRQFEREDMLLRILFPLLTSSLTSK
jgi:hypothetical protein